MNKKLTVQSGTPATIYDALRETAGGCDSGDDRSDVPIGLPKLLPEKRTIWEGRVALACCSASRKNAKCHVTTSREQGTETSTPRGGGHLKAGRYQEVGEGRGKEAEWADVSAP